MVLLPHRDHLNFELNIQRLEQRILLPSTDAEALHPCLINAICLGAMTVAGHDFDTYAKIFREQARDEMVNSLSTVDRMEHLLWASVILGWYWCRMGNDVQASALATSMSNGCCGFLRVLTLGISLVPTAISRCSLGHCMWNASDVRPRVESV